jgi:hypothetical protein
MNTYHLRTGVLLLVSLAALGGPAAAQSQPATGPSPRLVDLNRAIKAYFDEERDTAAAIFERLLTADPQAEYRASCCYYLGLISLERGLAHSSAAQAAAARQAPDQAATEANLAREQFEQAQQWFEQVVGLADPSAELVSAAVLLGIAQLASDYPGMGKDLAFELAQRAERTLTRYVTQTEPGARDRYGFFYLAVAHYRLADDYSQRGRSGEFAASLRAAAENLVRARSLTEADQQSGVLSAAQAEDFKTVLTYYDALLAVLGRDNARARALFTDVSRRAAGTDLAKNADAIVNKLTEVELANPAPLSIPAPKPVGPFEFSGHLRMGHAYDSNVILLGKDTALPLGYSRKDDYRFSLSADFNIDRYISKSELPAVGESLSLGLGGGTSNGWQPNLAQFDVNHYPARAYVNWQPVPDLYLGLQYEYSYTQLGHKPFIASNRLTPVISKVWRRQPGTELGRTDAYYAHDERSYLDRLSDFRLNRDGQYDAVGIQHTFNFWQAKDLPYMAGYFGSHERERRLLGNDWLRFRVGYEYRDERTVGTEFDLRGNSLVWGLNVPLPYRLAFEAGGEFTWSDYQNPSLFDYERKPRSDFLQRYDFGVTYTFVARGEVEAMRTLEVKLRTGIEATFQNSNIWDRLGEDVYEYNRGIYGVQLEVNF